METRGTVLEVMTPAAAAELFGITIEAVRAAIGKGKVAVAFTLALDRRDAGVRCLYAWPDGQEWAEAGYPVSVQRLGDSATEYWRDHRNDTFDGKLEEFRGHSMVISTSRYSYVRILHNRPVVEGE